MINETLLATYSLLTFIRESYDSDDKRDSLIKVFIPIVKEALALKLKNNNGLEYKGKDYSEIKQLIFNEFEFEIPIPVLDVLLPMVQEEASEEFQLFSDHSFIIKTACESTLSEEFAKKKSDIQSLKNNYSAFCKAQGVKADFAELINFIQDQKNRIFDKANTIIDSQDYYVSKYVRDSIRRKDKYYDIICGIYLGGIIGSYFEFEVSHPVFDVDLVIDTNFYVSLINLNTEEAYETCKQLYDITIAMGFRYYILETTIEQIKILLNNRLPRINNKDFISAVDEADILAACKRRGLSRDELEAEKTHLRTRLSQLGVSVIYNSQIRDLRAKAEKSSDMRRLIDLRGGSRESALNDILAKEYVEKKREGKAIVEFNDVNCWFLNNSFSTNKTELSKPIWQRTSINASDLLVLLWLANPSQKLSSGESMLAITSLSSNVLRYRSEKAPAHQIIEKIQDKVAKLQNDGLISQEDIAKLCVRMSEGCIDGQEAERIMSITSSEFLEYVKKMDDKETVYLEEHDENISLKTQLGNVSNDNIDLRAENKILHMRIWGVVYFLIIAVLYIVYKFVINGKLFDLPDLANWTIDIVYFLITIIGVNILNHKYFITGLYSFINKDKVKQRLIDALKNQTIF